MAMNFESKRMVDSILEYTALKTRILLTENNILTLAERHEGLELLQDCISDDNKWVRVDPTDFEAVLLSLRKAIGNIENTDSEILINTRRMKKLLAAGHNVASGQNVIEELIKLNAVNDEEMLFKLCRKRNVNPITVMELLLSIAEMQDRSPFLDVLPKIEYVE